MNSQNLKIAAIGRRPACMNSAQVRRSAAVPSSRMISQNLKNAADVGRRPACNSRMGPVRHEAPSRVSSFEIPLRISFRGARSS